MSAAMPQPAPSREPVQSVTPVEGQTRERPWGTVTLLEEGSHYRINRIVVAPHAHITTQMHHHRTEHWVVVSGTAKVAIGGGEELMIRQHESTYVPMNTAHRVENPGVIPLVMIEVQNGEYIGEDDIVRFPEEDSPVARIAEMGAGQ